MGHSATTATSAMTDECSDIPTIPGHTRNDPVVVKQLSYSLILLHTGLPRAQQGKITH
jgi:hypothetical protein